MIHLYMGAIVFTKNRKSVSFSLLNIKKYAASQMDILNAKSHSHCSKYISHASSKTTPMQILGFPQTLPETTKSKYG